jgi:hypothetical protein
MTDFLVGLFNEVNCCWHSPTESFLGPVLMGPMTIFFCLSVNCSWPSGTVILGFEPHGTHGHIFSVSLPQLNPESATHYLTNVTYIFLSVSGKLLLPSPIQSMFVVPSGPMTIFLFFPRFYMFWNGVSSSVRGGVWLLLVAHPVLGLTVVGNL